MHRGFTFIELMIVLAIIGVLASIIIVSLDGGSVRSKENAALQALRSGNAVLFSCINNGGVLQSPHQGEGFICSGGSESSLQARWPILPRGWQMTEETFSWCDPQRKEPVVACESFQDGSCGGDRSTGEYCFTVQARDRYILCSQAQCSIVLGRF